MMFVARRISLAKWPQHPRQCASISADAVTGDLRTQGNALSFWRCKTGEDGDIDQAVLAIAAASQRLDKIDIVWLADEEMQADGQIVMKTLGRTPITDLAGMHVDIRELDYHRLGKVAQRVAAAIEENRYRRVSKARARELLASAVQQKRVLIGALADKLRREIGRQ